jgi:ATP-dependent exoDNAse (exonuclease V) beta subunit
MLIQVKASAGSGKTHALTQRFLSLALRVSRELPPACAAVSETEYSLPEILAVTFTNKAAAEMRDRVIAKLKSLALGLDGADAASRGRARDELERLLIHAQRLNIRTIDSLLFLLARVFALDLGLRPDFEPAFDDAAILSDLYDRLAASLPEDPALARLFGDAAGALLQSTPGFLPTQPFRRRLLAVATRLLDAPLEDPAEAEALRLALLRRLGSLHNAAEALLAALEGAGLAGKSQFLDFLRHCRDARQADAPPRSAFAHKAGLAECVQKAGQGRLTPELEGLYAALQEAHGVCRRDLPVLLGAMGLAPFVSLARRLVADFPAYLTQMRVLPHSQWPRLVGARLAGAGGVPDAWCRMGAGLAHICIDEFQDTAVEQWRVLRLLALECLSRGGSLFLVGDVKQAIYGWRGGEAALFDQAPADPELARLGEVVRQRLPLNWRSAPAVVAINNRFFSPLGDPATARAVAEAMLGQEGRDAVPELATALASAFADAGQNLPEDQAGPKGHVRITALTAASAGDYEAAVRESLVRLVTTELVPRHGERGVAVLTRSNGQAAKVASWLIGAGVAVVTENSLRLADHPLIRQLVAMLAYLDYPPDGLSFWAFVSGRELFGDLSGLSREELCQWLAGLPNRGSPSLAFKERWPEVWARFIGPYLRQTGLAGPYDLTREIVTGYRILERRPADEAFVRRFLEIVHQAENRGHTSISAFLDFWNELGDDEKVPQPENVAAVRVMTIHKAKGLQFPAVVVPFHHFPGRSGEATLVTARVEEGEALTPDQPGLGPEYASRRARELAEQVHLLYVAWTRPELELHAFVPGCGKLRDDARYPLPKAMAILFAALGHDPATAGPLILGPKPEVAPAAPPACPAVPAPLPPPAEVPQPMAWLPRLMVYRNTVADIRDNLRFTEKRRGELVHAAAERFVQAGFDPADPLPAARLATGQALGQARLDPATRARLAEDIPPMLAWLAGQVQCAAALAGGLCERELLDPKGERHRPDVLHLGRQATEVLDFKTGQPSPDHAAQVARYLTLARAMPGRRQLPARGWLVYFDLGQCQLVGDMP